MTKSAAAFLAVILALLVWLFSQARWMTPAERLQAQAAVRPVGDPFFVVAGGDTVNVACFTRSGYGNTFSCVVTSR